MLEKMVYVVDVIVKYTGERMKTSTSFIIIILITIILVSLVETFTQYHVFNWTIFLLLLGFLSIIQELERKK
jgi:FtsH-binding integral membrane protein